MPTFDDMNPRSCIARSGFCLIPGFAPIEARRLAEKLEQFIVELGIVLPNSQCEVNPLLSRAELWEARQFFYKMAPEVAKNCLTPVFAASQIRISDLMKEAAIAHGRPFFRLIFPYDIDPEAHTLSHQDYQVFSGEVDMLTTWLPLINCARPNSTLEVAATSHLGGVLEVKPTGLTDKFKSYDVKNSERFSWSTFPYRCGDIMILHCLVAHRSSPNLTNKLRLSVDFRFYPGSGRQPSYGPMERWSVKSDSTKSTWEIWCKSRFYVDTL